MWKKIFVIDRMDLGLAQLCVWKASAGLVWMTWRLMSQLACDRKTEAAVVGATWEKLLRAPNRRVIFRSQQAQIAVMLQSPEFTMALSMKAKKKIHQALQMSKGHRVLYNLYPTMSANSRMCHYVSIPPSAQVALTLFDLRWLFIDTNKNSHMHCLSVS